MCKKAKGLNGIGAWKVTEKVRNDFSCVVGFDVGCRKEEFFLDLAVIIFVVITS
jgi:hypothetical protein